MYKIYMFLHRSDLNISEKFRQTFAKFRIFWILFGDFCSEFDEILSEFRQY